MPRYVPEDSMQSPRFTGPSTFARLPYDVVQVIPAYDPAGQTATLAANLAYEMLSLVALRRRGR